MTKTIGKEYLSDAIIEYCDDIITLKDLNFNYVAFNDAFLKYIDIPDVAEVIGKSVNDFFTVPVCNIFLDNLKKVVKELKPCCFTFVYQKEGFSKILKQTITPIIKNGIIQSILTVSSDITNEENLKSKLLDKNYQLNTLFENLPFFVYLKDKEKNLLLRLKIRKRF